MASGDVLLDEFGRRMLDADGNVLLDNGLADPCSCCGPGACTDCPDDTPARYSMHLSVTPCDCYDLGDPGDTGNPGSFKLEGDGLDADYCLYYARGDSCFWSCAIEDPDIFLTFYSDEVCGEVNEMVSIRATWISFVLARTADGKFTLTVGLIFDGMPEVFNTEISVQIFSNTGTAVENCADVAGFTLDNEYISADCGIDPMILAYDGTAVLTPSDSCICESGELCPDPCLLCNSCPPYSEDTTTLRLVLDGLSFGQCDDCDPGPEGPGCCVSEDPASDCKVCGGSPGIDCVCINVTDKADCLSNGWTWCCRGSSGTGTDGVSPCDNLPIDADVTLHITAHTATTQTYSATVGGDTYTVVHTCTSDHTASVFDVTVLAGGGTCRVHGIIGGGCGGGAGSVFTFTDDGLGNGECVGNGQGHGTITISWGCCS